MRPLLIAILLLLITMHASSQTKSPAWHEVLNGYVKFLTDAAEESEHRLKTIRAYHQAIEHYRTKRVLYGFDQSPSGTLNGYYYQAARKDNSRLTPAQANALQAGADRVWHALNALDEKCKERETYVRLEDYKQDGLRGSDALLQELAGLYEVLNREKANLWREIETVYGHYVPASSADPGLQIALAMRKVLDGEKALLDSWVFYLDEEKPAAWPAELVEKQIAENEKALETFAHVPADLHYPADDMVKSFRGALADALAAKRHALDEYNFEARLSAAHGNRVYLDLHNHFNNSLLSFYDHFVQYSRPNYRLLAYPKAVLRFAVVPPASQRLEIRRAKPFKDAPLRQFTTHPAAAPIAESTREALNHYIDFINESLRQIHNWQYLLRDYAAAAEDRKAAPAGRKQRPLTYSHREIQLPHSFYGQVVSGSGAIPAAYRPSVLSQAEVLMNILKEMDALSVELIGYTTENHYEEDQFKRSDEILTRYHHLIGQFDDRKEQLYRDVRRIDESYPPIKPDDSWYVAGRALLEVMDLDKAFLFGMRDYLGSKTNNLPASAPLEAASRKLLKEEYKNMKGLTRLGTNNGNCPYNYYEHIAENSIRLAAMTPRQSGAGNPYESFYFFYRNQLIEDYNRFAELAQPRQLKNINQMDRFVTDAPDFVRRPQPVPLGEMMHPDDKRRQESATYHEERPDPAIVDAAREKTVQTLRDTVYVERVDTVYVDRDPATGPVRSLEGYANNNLVLLLDVSASMNAPHKLPLLKKSVKALLQLLRPTDQVSIVVYSGKAKVALEAVTGGEVSKIEAAIDALHSDGGTDGNAGIRLAYKLANRHYLRGGNNRIVLATDGEFPVSSEVHEVVQANAGEDIYLTVFHFTPKQAASATLQQLADKGRGTYTHITPENADARLLSEAQAKRAK